MSLFTFNSRARNTWRVLGFVVLCFVGLEFVVRLYLFRASKDFETFRTYPERAERLVHGPGLRVALIGNSAVREGVDLAVFEKAIEASGTGPVKVDKFPAAGSHINTWHFMLERCFWQPERQLDLIIILFFDQSLEDDNDLEIGRLAWFFTTVKDWPELFRTDLRNASQRVDFVFSSVSAAVAGRERLKRRWLAMFIPGFENYQQRINSVNYAHSRRLAGAEPSAGVTHRVLRRFLNRAQARGSKVCFVAFPTLVPGRSTPYDVNPEAVELIRAAGMHLIDLRRMHGLKAEMYATRTHLNESGRPVFSRCLAEAVAPWLAATQAGSAVRDLGD